jgi:hypothetical protein
MGSKMKFPGHGCMHEKTKKVKATDAQGHPVYNLVCKACGDTVGVQSRHIRREDDRNDRRH